MKKHTEIDTVTNLLWISFGLMGGLSHYVKKDYWICGIFFLVAILYALKLYKSQRKKWQDRSK